MSQSTLWLFIQRDTLLDIDDDIPHSSKAVPLMLKRLTGPSTLDSIRTLCIEYASSNPEGARKMRKLADKIVRDAYCSNPLGQTSQIF